MYLLRHSWFSCLAFVGLLTLTLQLGCRAQANPAEKPTTAEGRAWFESLPGVSRSTSQPMQEELTRLRMEKALPEDLAVAATAKNGPAWQAIFPDFTRQHTTGQIDRLFPGPALSWTAAELQKAKETLPRLAAIREQFAAEIERTERLDVPISAGLLSPPHALEVLQLGARLEVLFATYHLAEDDPASAVPSAALLFRTAWLLASEGTVTPRLAAGRIRASALRVLVAAHNHRLASVETSAAAVSLLTAELARWPADAVTWQRERAQGMLTYELVRGGHFLALLNDEELAELRGRNILKVTAKTVRQNVDADQLRYLTWMRRLIETSDRPYHLRLAELNKMQGELEALRNTPEFPVVAAMLLAEFQVVQQRQAEDFAQLRGVLLAFQQATGDEASMAVNPLTGRPIIIDTSAEEVVLRLVTTGNEPPFRLRKRS